MSTENEQSNTGERFRTLLNQSGPVQPNKPAEDYEADAGTKLRAVLQGLSFGSADEIEAFVRSLRGEDQQEVLDSIRDNLELYRQADPIGAYGREAGGAMIPGLLAAPFTGGASVPATMGRLAAVGALEGGAYAFNTGEDGFKNRAARVPGGALTGAVMNPAVSKTVGAGAEMLKALGREARFLVGRRGSSIVNNEIQRLANKLQETPEEIVQGIMDGRILAENKTLAAAVKNLRARGGEAGDIINERLTARPGETRARAAEAMDEALGGDGQLQYAKRQATNKAVKDAENKAYAPFKDQDVNDQVFGEMILALERVPSAGKDLLKYFQTKVGTPGYEPLFKKGKGGKIEFLRKPTAQEAEEIRKALDAKTTAQYSKRGGGFLGSGFEDAATEFRDALDINIPELASARATAKAARDNKDAFNAGRQTFTGKMDEKLFELQELFGRGNADEIAAFRSGMLSAIQAQLKSPNRASFIRKLGNDEDGLNEILRMALPEQSLDDVLKKLDIAEESQAAKGAIMDRTNTAETLIESQAVNLGLTPQTILDAGRLDPRALGQVARSFVSMFGRDLTDAERARIAKILVSEDPGLVRAAIMDDSALQKLGTMIGGIVNTAAKVTPRATTRLSSEATANETGNNVRGLIDMMTGPQ